MNQILEPHNNKNVQFSSNSSENTKQSTKKEKLIKNIFLQYLSNNKYRLQFFLSSAIAFIFIGIFSVRLYKQNENETISQDLLSIYHTSTLYSNTLNYSAQSISSNTENLLPEYYQSNQSTPFVIGMIRIDKINVNYSILSHTNRESLKISLSRFAGPMPNEIGNLCIAGHNYVDYKFFSRLHELELNDKIKIYDLTGKLIEYKVTDKYETNPNDVSCTNQDTKGKPIVTLLTCNNVNGKRLIIKAKPM